MQKRPTLNDKDWLRFWVKVDKTNTCWIWTAGQSNGGYGRFGLRRDGRKWTLVVHRLTYELFVGGIPDGLQIDHLCKNRLCVNPKHLEPVTALENNRRIISRGGNRGTKAPQKKWLSLSREFEKPKSVCVRGHEMKEENMSISKQGWIRCRTCSREAVNRWREIRRKHNKLG